MTSRAEQPSAGGCITETKRTTGYVSASRINRQTVGKLALRHELSLDGPVLSTPAVVDGSSMSGWPTAGRRYGQNGGAFYQVALATGEIAAVFHWDIPAGERDSHGFCGMAARQRFATGACTSARSTGGSTVSTRRP
jgi:hypothetical protein